MYVVALVGGGTNHHPGEISLAHNGVLFLDELPEYKRSALEVLHQPLEDRHITVARTKETVDYPASFMLVAAMNPCPCGHYGEHTPAHPCTYTPAQVQRYLSKISEPLLDRIDILMDCIYEHYSAGVGSTYYDNPPRPSTREDVSQRREPLSPTPSVSSSAENNIE